MTMHSWLSLLNSTVPVPQDRLRVGLVRFAEANGWRPSDLVISYPGTEQFATGHILVEHGLSHSAVLTFLRRDVSFEDLDRTDQTRVLSLSYNNLVDWHCFPSNRGQLIVYNRSQKTSEAKIEIPRRSDAWRVEAFDAVIGRKPNPNFPALDDALIRTVSRWKRILASELGLRSAEPIAELFNAIFFARSLEDTQRFQPTGRGLLLDLLDETPGQPTRTILHTAIERLCDRPSSVPETLIDMESLRIFDGLDDATKYEIFADFYQNGFAPYRYDFSVITKHALSRIYERYIALLGERESDQLTLFGRELEEYADRSRGAVYTPQFIARFFARFLEANHTPARFERLKTIDPACGSGIFLRTLLEMQCDPQRTSNLSETVARAFRTVRGVDVDQNACKAARLSLCLLHLTLTGEFPASIAIDHDDAIRLLLETPSMANTFDAVIANPPFVKWERLSVDSQELVTRILGDLRLGRSDLYLAFLKGGIDLLAAGGYLLFVLPRSFLVADSAQPLRSYIADTCWVHVLADLSDVDVFGDLGTYPILIILQKHQDGVEAPRALLARCSGFVGHALQDVVAGNTAEMPSYSIYRADQGMFRGDIWRVSTPKQAGLLEKFATFPKLSDFLEIRQGIVTGMDRVFIRAKVDVSPAEHSAYIELLRDRDIAKYQVPRESDWLVFYPFDGERLLEGTEIQTSYPETWAHLEANRANLEGRRSMSRLSPDRWWQPVWPRAPRAMLRPKIVTPHLVLFPRFALDSEGKYGVSHAPYLFPSRSAPGEEERRLLLYFLAVLNSSAAHWQSITLSGKYRKGYAVLEPATLKKVRVPSPAVVPSAMMRTILEITNMLADPRMPRDPMAEEKLDQIVADLYGIDLAAVSEIPVGGDSSDG